MFRAFWALPLLMMAGACGPSRFMGSVLIAHHKTNVRVVGAFSGDGQKFAVAETSLSSEGGNTVTIRLWRRGPSPDLPTRWRIASQIRLRGLFVIDVVFSPDAQLLAFAGIGRRSSIIVWDLARRRFLGFGKGLTPVVQSIAFGPRGRWLTSAGLDGKIHVWDVQRRRRLSTVRDDVQLLRQTRFPIAVAPDGSWLAYGRSDGKVAFADPATGIVLDARPSGGKTVHDLAPSPNGRWLAAASERGVHLWDMTRPGSKKRWTLSNERALAVAFFSDGRKLVACGVSPGRSKVYEVPSGRLAYSISTRGKRTGGTGIHREREIERSLRRAFPVQSRDPRTRLLVKEFARTRTTYRVIVSPEDFWVAFFERGNARVVITRSHYRRLTRKRRFPPKPAAESPIEKTI